MKSFSREKNIHVDHSTKSRTAKNNFTSSIQNEVYNEREISEFAAEQKIGKAEQENDKESKGKV